MGHWVLAGLLGGTWGVLFVRWCARRDAAWWANRPAPRTLEVVPYQPAETRRVVVLDEGPDGVFRAS